MLPLPDILQKVLMPFACLFTRPTWQKAQVLVIGAVLAPRKCTVTAALWVMGVAQRSDPWLAKDQIPPGAKSSCLVYVYG
jgi:hypothetical protein